MENFGVPPDVSVDNSPASHAAKRDVQIEKAVEVLKADLAARTKR
jgi:tricorn protease